jgi:hypothetical protein
MVISVIIAAMCIACAAWFWRCSSFLGVGTGARMGISLVGVVLFVFGQSIIDTILTGESFDHKIPFLSNFPGFFTSLVVLIIAFLLVILIGFGISKIHK